MAMQSRCMGTMQCGFIDTDSCRWACRAWVEDYLRLPVLIESNSSDTLMH
jgi:hypothetical protein